MNDIENFVNYTCEEANCYTKVIKKSLNSYLFKYPCSSFTQCSPYKVTLHKGKYRFLLWGAQGGDARYLGKTQLRDKSGGRGAHVQGTLSIKTMTSLLFYIGGKGEDQSEIEPNAFGKGGYNGGGDGAPDPLDATYPESAAGGGGATDIRILHDSHEIESLKSRIAVAAGGGGACSTNDNYTACSISNDSDNSFLCLNDDVQFDYKGGPGGILFGYTYNLLTFGGKQNEGSFGNGSNGVSFDILKGGSIGGGGGGYYGGECIKSIKGFTQYYELGGAGGSSYISGYSGCDSVLGLPKNQVKHSHSSFHYSGYSFSNIKTFSGLDEFKSPNDELEKGHTGSGAILLKYLGPVSPNTVFCKRKLTNSFLFLVFII